MPAEGGLPKNLSNHPATDTVPDLVARWPVHLLSFRPQRLESGLEDARRRQRSAARITRGGGVHRVRIPRWDGHLLFRKPMAARWPLDRRIRRRQRADARPDPLPPQSRPRPIEVSGVSLSARGSGRGPRRFSSTDSTGFRRRIPVLRLPRPVGLGLSLAPDESWLLFSQLRRLWR